MGKLNRLKATLQGIRRTQFGDVEGKDVQAKTELEECQKKLQKDPLNIRLIEEEARLAK